MPNKLCGLLCDQIHTLLAVGVLGLWVLGAVLAVFWVLGFWILGFWMVGFWVLGCWYPNSGFEELAEGRNALSSPCGAA